MLWIIMATLAALLGFLYTSPTWLVARWFWVILVAVTLVGLALLAALAIRGMPAWYTGNRRFWRDRDQARWVALAFFALGLGVAFVFLVTEVVARRHAVPSHAVAPTNPAVLAQWIQVVPPESCQAVTQRWEEAPASQAAPTTCEPDLRLRVVVSASRPGGCPSVSTTPGTPALTKVRPHGGIGKFADILVCETILDSKNVESLMVSHGRSMKLPGAWRNRQPFRVVIAGDTGCRNDERQSCKKQWRFEDVSREQAGAKPDLAIHVGDYLYVKKDDWGAWNTYFFTPARELLDAAPFIPVRGNHENCTEFSDAPEGYSLFFGIGQTATPCPAADDRLLTYALDLPGVRLIVADSSLAYAIDPEEALKKRCRGGRDRETCTRIMGVLSHVGRFASTAGDRAVWLATHVPVFGLDRDPDDQPFVPNSSAMMLAAWRGLPTNRQNPLSPVRVVLSGDRHLFQVVSKTDQSGDPRQFIVGTGGVELDALPHGPVETDFGGVTPPPSMVRRVSWEGCSYRGLGFLQAESSGGRHQFTFKALNPPPAPGPCMTTTF